MRPLIVCAFRVRSTKVQGPPRSRVSPTISMGASRRPPITTATTESRQDRGQEYPIQPHPYSRLCLKQGQTAFPLNFTLSPTKSSSASLSFGMSPLRTTRHQEKHLFFSLFFSVSTPIAEPTPRPQFRWPWQTSELSPYVATFPFRDTADNTSNRHLLVFLTVSIWSVSQLDRSRLKRTRKPVR